MMLVKQILANSSVALMGLGAIAITVISSPQTAIANSPQNLPSLLQQAISSDPAISKTAIANLREFKDAGVTAFLNAYQKELPNNPQLRATLDAICQQKDCDASRLYWYTDLDAAKTAAQKTGKPILSLRLLGNLSDELSCANSRFFRTALYPNAAVSQLLRDRFILHWQSERPVPKVTIDFGDGRKLEQTITGNSIHYVLDRDGLPIDAIPGLYSPQAFIEQLKDAENVAKLVSKANTPTLRREALVKYHREQLAKLEQNWRSDLTRLRLPIQPLLERPEPTANTPSALLASRLTVGKMMVEMPTLTRTNSEPLSEVTPTDPFAKLSDTNWARLARLYQNRVYLDQGSLQLMQRKLPASASLPTVVSSFETAIAQDTVRNEYVFHAQIHNWFANGEFIDNYLNGEPSRDVSPLVLLNRRVYDQLFLTPASDPWLGLVNENVYTGISKVN